MYYHTSPVHMHRNFQADAPLCAEPLFPPQPNLRTSEVLKEGAMENGKLFLSGGRITIPKVSSDSFVTH